MLSMQHGHDCMAQATGTYVLAAANSNFDDPGRHSSFIPPPQPGTRSDYEHQLLVHQITDSASDRCSAGNTDGRMGNLHSRTPHC